MTLTKETIYEHLYDLEQVGSNGLGIVDRSAKISIDGMDINQSVTLLHESTGAMVWQSTLELLRYLESSNLNKLVYNRTIVELGCGTGALARLIAPKTLTYYATDQKPLLNLARRNTQDLAHVKVMEFDWEKNEWDSDTFPADCIIACDTIYNEFLVPHLIDALRSVCGARDVPIILALQIREVDMLLAAFELLLDEFTMECRHTTNGVAIYLLHLRTKLE